MYGRVFAVGDIHGSFSHLKSLIDYLQPNDTDLWVFLGDYVDRGPQTREVIDLLLKLSERTTCVFLRGNHEVMLLAAIPKAGSDRSFWLKFGGQAVLASYGLTADQTPLKFPREHLRFLQDTEPLFEYRRSETECYIFAHASHDPSQGTEDWSDDVLYWNRPLSTPHRSGALFEDQPLPQRGFCSIRAAVYRMGSYRPSIC